MTDQIPGVPEGWELVRIGVVHHGEWRLMDDKTIEQWDSKRSSSGWAVVLRKIEKPAAYRQFKDAEEYLPHWGKPVKYQDSLGFDSIISTSELGVYTAQGRMVQFFTMEQAFGFLTFADGTPFGVKIDE
jgi:hypothetical protein